MRNLQVLSSPLSSLALLIFIYLHFYCSQWKKVNEANLQHTIWGQTDIQTSKPMLSAADYKLLEEMFSDGAHLGLPSRPAHVCG